MILVCGFKHCLFSPLLGEDEPILTSIFFKGVGSTTNQDSSHFWSNFPPVDVLQNGWFLDPTVVDGSEIPNNHQKDGAKTPEK